jgi:hypothetical protein
MILELNMSRSGVGGEGVEPPTDISYRFVSAIELSEE